MERTSFSSLKSSRARRYCSRFSGRIFVLFSLILLYMTVNSTVYQGMSWSTTLENKLSDQSKNIEALIIRQAELDVKLQLLDKQLNSLSEGSVAEAFQDSVRQVEKKVNTLEPLLSYVASLLQQSLQTDSRTSSNSQKGQTFIVNKQDAQQATYSRTQPFGSRFERESASLLAGPDDQSINMVLSQVTTKNLRGNSAPPALEVPVRSKLNNRPGERSFESLSADLLVAGQGKSVVPKGKVEVETSLNQETSSLSSIDASMVPNYQKIQEYLAAHPIKAQDERGASRTETLKGEYIGS